MRFLHATTVRVQALKTPPPKYAYEGGHTPYRQWKHRLSPTAISTGLPLSLDKTHTRRTQRTTRWEEIDTSGEPSLCCSTVQPPPDHQNTNHARSRTKAQHTTHIHSSFNARKPPQGASPCFFFRHAVPHPHGVSSIGDSRPLLSIGGELLALPLVLLPLPPAEGVVVSWCRRRLRASPAGLLLTISEWCPLALSWLDDPAARLKLNPRTLLDCKHKNRNDTDDGKQGSRLAFGQAGSKITYDAWPLWVLW